LALALLISSLINDRMTTSRLDAPPPPPTPQVSLSSSRPQLLSLVPED